MLHAICSVCWVSEVEFLSLINYCYCGCNSNGLSIRVTKHGQLFSITRHHLTKAQQLSSSCEFRSLSSFHCTLFASQSLTNHSLSQEVFASSSLSPDPWPLMLPVPSCYTQVTDGSTERTTGRKRKTLVDGWGQAWGWPVQHSRTL